MPYSFVLVGGHNLVNQTPWQQLKSRCLWEEINLFLQLGFFCILLIYPLRKFTFWVCKYRFKVVEPDPEPSRIHTNVSSRNFYSMCILLCSTLLLGVHSTLLLLTVQKKGVKGTDCISYHLSLSTEGANAVMWAAVMFVSYRIHTRNHFQKPPGILRLWWITNFLLSVIDVAFIPQHVFVYHQQLQAKDYAHIVGLISSVCLLALSVRVKAVFSSEASSSSSFTDPLLLLQESEGCNEKFSKGTQKKRGSLYSNTSLLQRVTFSWLNPLFVIGNKKPLEKDEIPDIDSSDAAAPLSHTFHECIKQANKIKDSGQNQMGLTISSSSQCESLYRTLFWFSWREVALNGSFAVVSAMASYVGPYLINDFVDFLGDKKNRSLKTGYLIALGFLVGKVVETTAQRQWVFRARRLGLHIRAALITQIYQKGLVLSTRSRQSHTSGEVMNYMSVDIQRITDFSWYLNTVWMLPIQISLAIFILHTNLGLGSFAALVATMVVMSCNIPLTRTQKKYQMQIMQSKDSRMKTTTEVLRNIKTIKLQAWDNRFLEKIESLRRTESNWLWKSLRLAAIGAFIFWGAPTFISVVTFGACLLMGIPLTAGRVISALATFRMLQDPIFILPDLLNVVAQAKVSADRISAYLKEEEIQSDAIDFVPKESTAFAIEIEGGEFCWDQDKLIKTSSSRPTLEGIQLKVERGMKVAICGTVGSGKSSLLLGIIGELEKISGSLRVSGSKAYVPQSPWILTGNVRENILFGNPYDAEKYRRIVKACALEKDFELFPCGDMTEIGERGINMSGGQKQRIQIARAAYQDADIYLLDDPFSAVDAHTGTQLFQDCLLGILADKTILYVTHQVEFLPAADFILVMENGRIAQAGSFKDLLEQNIGFEALVGAHNQALESILAVESSSRLSSQTTPSSSLDVDDSSDPNADLNLNSESKHQKECQRNGASSNVEEIVTADKKGDGKLIQDEEREKGSIGKEVYWSYLTIVKGGLLVPSILLAQSSFQALQVASNYWIAWATPSTTNGNNNAAEGMDFVLLIYTLLAVGGSLCILVRGTLVATAGLLTAQKLFTNMLRSVLRAPMSFFDSTPNGRILNRMSSDQSVLDLELANRLGWVAFSTIQLIGTIVVMSQVAWEVFVIFIPVTAICLWYKQYYIPTARELARIAEIQKAPILHHFSESLAGSATIHAFNQQGRFIEANMQLVDNHTRPWFHNMAAIEWLSYRLNQLSNFVFAFSLVLLVSLPDGIINPSIAGLAVTYGINLNVSQAAVIWNLCNAENKMISVERILQYSKLKSEAPLVIDNSRPPYQWPTFGTICFRNLQIRYSEHLPAVLKSISCTFPGKQKIGVVGRTGSGKSTLIQALFRIVEPTEGSIVIDDVDICKIGLHDLRSRLSIIPQDPSMFNGTVRGNLDPLQQYSDKEIWEALEKCQLGETVGHKEDKLDSIVVENGENWSVGQRQLFCLGRALLKRSSILVLDEATASVDSATDNMIQKIINQEFNDRTVITIAHRIHTVIESDLILVLSEGRIVEYDEPSKLLKREDSFFSRLIREYSTRSQGFGNTSSDSSGS